MRPNIHTRPAAAHDAKRAEAPHPLMTVDGVAARRGCSAATVWRHVKAGILPPPIKLGGLTRWVPDEVEAAIEAAKAARNPKSAA